ncbi:MAG: 3-deoxy-D-manno-octulosonic acid transferase [Burkholderiales bacterium]|nr:3-deoxy-D-manno-octulosonic acid transferase [Burkholderiales bacterium]
MTLGQNLARAAYSTLLRLGTPAYLARLWWRGRAEPLYRHAMGQRLALGSAAQAPGAIWLHAVSLGETRAAAALVQALRTVRPGTRFVFTHGTATGLEAGKALMQPGDTQTWLPFDTPGAVRRFLRAQQPVLGVLMETEIWPNLLLEAAAAGVPMVLANARLSERSARKGERFAALLRPAAERLSLALAQTEADAQRLRASGVADVCVAGNLKYDLNPDAAQAARGQRWRQAIGRPVVAMTNTRVGEEGPLLQAWAALPAPRPQLLIVPRHPQRFDEVAQRVVEAGFTLSRRSGWIDDLPPAEANNADVWLGDSLGEMALYYGAADVALLGGSFEPLGGHNLIESAASGCPIVLGPSTFNFAEAAELALAEGAAWRVASLPAAVALAQQLLNDHARLAAAAAQARAFSARHRGAAQRMATEIAALLAPVALTSPAAR